MNIYGNDKNWKLDVSVFQNPYFGHKKRLRFLVLSDKCWLSGQQTNVTQRRKNAKIWVIPMSSAKLIQRMSVAI